jgi:hypothetical protein
MASRSCTREPSTTRQDSASPVDVDGFGMGGTGGHYGVWSAVGGYAFAFVTALMGTHERADRIEDALREVVGAPPL